MAEHEQEARSPDVSRKRTDDAAQPRPKRQPAAAAPPPKSAKPGGATDEASLRVEVIRASLLTAWHRLDQAVSSLRAERDASERKTLADRTVAEVMPYVKEALGALTAGGAELDDSLVHNHVEFTGRALNAFREALGQDHLVGDSFVARARALAAHAALYETYLRLSSVAGLRRQLPDRRHVRANKPAAVDRSLDAVLELARLEATRVFGELVRLQRDDPRHIHIVDRLTDSLGHHLEHATTLLGTVEGKALAGESQAKVDAASAAILKVDRWIDGRQDNFALASKLTRLIAKADQLRTAAQLVPIGMLDTPAMPIMVTKQEGAEVAEIEEAGKSLSNALDTALDAYKEGALRFLKFAELKRPPPETPLWEELAKGILTAVLTNLAGPLMVRVAKRVAAGELTHEMTGYIAGSATDSVQASVGPIVSALANSPAKQDSNGAIRSRQLFKESMVLAQGELDAKLKARVAIGIRDKKTSAAAIRKLAADVRDEPSQLIERAYRECAHGYALLTAQSALQVQTRSGSKVSNMDNYFAPGEESTCEATGSKRGTPGVGRLKLDVRWERCSRNSRIPCEPTAEGEQPSVQIGRFELIGMSDDLAIAVLQRAQHRLGRLGLPLEIEMPPQFQRHIGARPPDPQPLMVIDEAGVIRHAIGWDALRTTPYSPDGEGFPEYIYRPDLVWAAIRDQELPKDTARIVKGG